MNRFDEWFFSSYLPEGDEMLMVAHRHEIGIVARVAVWLFFGLFIPFYFYYVNLFSVTRYLEASWIFGWFGCVYLWSMYRIFDWYNDVWIVTKRGVIDIDWSLFGRTKQYLEYRDIAGIDIVESNIFEAWISKGDIIIKLHSEGDEFELPDARDPHGIVDIIQQSTEAHGHHNEEHEEEKDPELDPYEKLVETLGEIVREHLEKQSGRAKASEDDVRAIRAVLGRPGTVDLRSAEERAATAAPEDGEAEDSHDDGHAHGHAHEPLAEERGHGDDHHGQDAEHGDPHGRHHGH